MKMTVRHISDVCSAKFYLSFNTFNFVSLLLRAVTFVYLKSSDFVVEKPPLPDKVKQKEILKR